MAVDFLFEKATKTIPTIEHLKTLWQNIPDESVRDTICYENQYLEFHVWQLRNIRYTKAGCATAPPYTKELGLSVRAGAVKAAVLLCASIAEAALRAHAEELDYELPHDPKKRMFGAVLKAWKIAGTPRPAVAPIWGKLTELHESRNNVHLHKAAQNPNAFFREVLAREEATLSNASVALKHLRTIKST